MTVLDIIILDLGYSADGKDIHGTVQIAVTGGRSGYRTLCLTCRCPASARIRHDALLVGDALRQLRRLPELRNGDGALHFAEGLTPLQPAARVA